MKKLGKLSINSEKVMKNEELISLKGGYMWTFTCCCYGGGCFDVEVSDYQELYDIVSAHCGSGGNCTPC